MKAFWGVKAITLTLLLTMLTGAAYYAGRAGTGAPKPMKNPVSIREGSATQPLTSGRSHVRYFYGGGFRGGK